MEACLYVTATDSVVTPCEICRRWSEHKEGKLVPKGSKCDSTKTTSSSTRGLQLFILVVMKFLYGQIDECKM